MRLPTMNSRYVATIIAALFTCIVGVLYLVALHIEHAPDELFREGFIAGVTLTTGSMAIERTTRGNGNGGNGNGR